MNKQMDIPLSDENDSRMKQVKRLDGIVEEIEYEFPVQGTNVNELNAVIEDWSKRLKDMCELYPHSISDESVEHFSQYLVDNQRQETGHKFANGSWTIPEDGFPPFLRTLS